eukprot:EC720563.1.p1 GENE.EC720563.1~~EC720563.1.p1  ORF type:complete len:148 (+),score=41.97 EC720563.1:30-473(+)
MAGVAIPDTVVAEFDNMKLKKTYGFIIFRLSDDRRSVIVDKTGDVRAQDTDSVETLNKKFTDFISLLPPNECRYAVYDFVYQHEGAPRSKIIFINWAPESAKTMVKVPHAATKEPMKRALSVGVEVQACDASEADFNSVLEKISKTA